MPPWIMEDSFPEVREERPRRGCGLVIGRERLLFACWADDTWIFAKSADESHMIQALEEAAARMAGLQLRLLACHWTRIPRQGQDFEELRRSAPTYCRCRRSRRGPA